MTRRPAIHRDQKLRAIARKGLDCLRVGAVAFKNPVRNIDHARCAAAAEIIVKQRRGGSAIDVIISENRNPFAALYRFRYAASCAHASPAASSRPRHGRPSTERSTPRNARGGQASSDSLIPENSRWAHEFRPPLSLCAQGKGRTLGRSSQGRPVPMRTTRLGAERFQSEIIKVLVTAAICAYVQIHGAGTVSPPCLDLSQGRP